MHNRRKPKTPTARQIRQARRNRAVLEGSASTPGFRHLNWFDANIAAFLMERGGVLPKASELVLRKRQTMPSPEQSPEVA